MTIIPPQVKPSTRQTAIPAVQPAPSQVTTAPAPTSVDRLVKTPAISLPSVPSNGQLPTFKTFEQFRKYADATPVSRLPEYQKVLHEVTGVRANAQKMLADKKSQVGYGKVEAEYKAALTEQDHALHPGRERALKLTRQANDLTGQIGVLTREIGNLQANVSRMQGSLNRGSSLGKSESSLGSLILIGAEAAGRVATHASINENLRSAADKQGQIAQLLVQSMDLKIQAATFETMKPDPVTLAAAQASVSKAKAALQQLDAQIAPEVHSVSSAEPIYQQAKKNVDHLTALKAGLQDYKARFSTFTALTNPSIKRQFAAYWGQN